MLVTVWCGVVTID